MTDSDNLEAKLEGGLVYDFRRLSTEDKLTLWAAVKVLAKNDPAFEDVAERVRKAGRRAFYYLDREIFGDSQKKSNVIDFECAAKMRNRTK